MLLLLLPLLVHVNNNTLFARSRSERTWTPPPLLLRVRLDHPLVAATVVVV